MVSRRLSKLFPSTLPLPAFETALHCVPLRSRGGVGCQAAPRVRRSQTSFMLAHLRSSISHAAISWCAARQEGTSRGSGREQKYAPPHFDSAADYQHAGVSRAIVHSPANASPCLRPERAAFCAATLTTQPIKKTRHPDMFPKLFLIKSWPELKWKSCSEAQH